MKIYNFGSETGKKIDAFDSKNLIMTKILNGTKDTHVGCMYIEANGIVGLHQAVTPQLFLVMSGEGIVKGKGDKELIIKAGFAAYWEAEEWHETKTETGLTAIVIEGITLELMMEEKEWLKTN
ncbi:cupin domain-containing protein [Paenibacillus wynnii]|uniref:cupin domain-containing protein n=1 Tax=Paenibacillus wynnii TaxID=268407 RepID=UPI002793EDA1|nr:cupin domain-containing protein [Paenibacillus wynnii]MDQ0193250.1 quercetin dioxygenase-like cupin family protein [Paenibacillus wynnii]